MKNSISQAFLAFQNSTPEHAEAWRELITKLSAVSALDSKTHNLAFLSILAAMGRVNGIPFHTKLALSHGATREEILSALLTGLPIAGHVVTESLPPALAILDQ